MIGPLQLFFAVIQLSSDPLPDHLKYPPLLVGYSGCQLRELAGGLARGAFALRSPLLVVCRSPQIDSGISGVPDFQRHFI